jgi:hypothetical protein
LAGLEGWHMPDTVWLFVLRFDHIDLVEDLSAGLGIDEMAFHSDQSLCVLEQGLLSSLEMAEECSMAFFVQSIVHQVRSKARVGNTIDRSVHRVSQARFRVEDIEVVIPDLFVIVEVGFELGESVESKVVDGAVLMVSAFDIGFFPIEDIADIIGSNLVFSLVDNDRVMVGLPKAVLNPVATWMFWIIGVFLFLVLAQVRN